MSLFVDIVFLLLLSSVSGTSALQWTAQTSQQTTMTVCRGQDLELDWGYTLRDGETAEDKRWDVVTDHSQEVMAMSVRGNFLTMPAFSGRVSHHGNASLTLHGVGVGDSGNYSVDVTGTHRDSGTFTTIRHTARVTVAEPPSSSSSSGGVTVRQEMEAVYDSATDSYHVQLTCGGLDQPGVPPVHLVWQTPSGSEEASSTVINGTYHLVLDNPVQGGNYTCRLPPLSPAAACLPADASLLREATVQVDGVLARFSLVEAKNGRLTDEVNMLRTENTALKAELKADLDNVNDTLKAKIENDNVLLKEEMNNLNAQLKAELSDVNDTLTAGLQQTTSNLTTQLSLVQQGLQSQLTDFQNKSSLHVSFHAHLGSGQQFTSNSHIKFDVITANEGNAYDAQSGTFTAPVGGTFFFIFTTSPYGSNGYQGDALLSVGGTTVAWVQNKVDNDYDLATGHVVVHLDMGTQVWVQGYSSQFYSHLYCSFSGFLIHPEW